MQTNIIYKNNNKKNRQKFKNFESTEIQNYFKIKAIIMIKELKKIKKLSKKQINI